MLRQWMHDLFFTTRIPLVWELWALIIIKLLGFTLIWYFFFSDPIGPQLTDQTVVEHFTRETHP